MTIKNFINWFLAKLKALFSKQSSQALAFRDLTFTTHTNVNNGVQARLDLGNDLEFSVVSMKKREGEFGGLYGDLTEGTYEVAVFHKNDMLPLNAFDDVLGWQTEDEVTELMGNLQGRQADVAGFLAFLYTEKDEARADLGLTNHS